MQRAFIGAFTAFTAACKVRRVKALFILFEDSLKVLAFKEFFFCGWSGEAGVIIFGGQGD